MNHQTNRRSWLSIVMTVLITACAFSMGVSPLQAKGGKTKVTDLSGIVPTITGIEVVNGQLVASGVATAIVKGQIVTSNFKAHSTLHLRKTSAVRLPPDVQFWICHSVPSTSTCWA
jgi:hypothetical protein